MTKINIKGDLKIEGEWEIQSNEYNSIVLRLSADEKFKIAMNYFKEWRKNIDNGFKEYFKEYTLVYIEIRGWLDPGPRWTSLDEFFHDALESYRIGISIEDIKHEIEDIIKDEQKEKEGKQND